MNPSPRSRPSGLPPALDRRFEAVILWSGTRAMSARTAQALTALSEADVFVGWLAPAPVQDLAEELKPAVGAAALLLADSEGSGAVAIDPSGTHRFGEPHRDLDLAALDEAGRTFAETLAGVGLAASAPRRPTGHPRVRIGLDRDTGPPTWSGLKQLLLAHGIPGVSHLADLATEAAYRAGLDEPRVVVEGSRVEIALVDAGDVALEHARRAVAAGGRPAGGPGGRRWVVGRAPPPGARDRPRCPGATVVLVNGGRGSPRSGMVVLTGGTTRLHQLLADQLRRRRRRALPEASARAGWSLVVEGFDVENERVHEAILTLADGHVGTSGAPLASDPSRHPWVVAAGIYDGNGADTHLLTGPVAFELGEPAAGAPLRRVLDLRTGVLHEHGRYRDRRRRERAVRFARPADDGRLPSPVSARAAGRPAAAAPGGRPRPRSGSRRRCHLDPGRRLHRRDRGGGGSDPVGRPAPGDGTDADTEVLDRVAVYRSDPDSLPDPAPAVDAVGQAATVGFDRLLAEHRQAWARRWEDADVVVEGDDELQLGIRFALFHLMASVADSGEAAVGARGLTGTGYSGHVFWDADTFVLPFLAATHPASARAMLEYRLRRLPAAIEAARAAGRAGARFPWESARTGRDVTPTSARDRSGRIVPIRTGQLEEHIVAQVAWAACCYMDWSGDEEFARGPGRRILVETARYWASRIRVEPDGSAHIYGVIGPDEYHEPVDDNAFTNVMARWNMRRAAEAVEAGRHGRRRRCRRAAALARAGRRPGRRL